MVRDPAHSARETHFIHESRDRGVLIHLAVVSDSAKMNSERCDLFDTLQEDETFKGNTPVIRRRLLRPLFRIKDARTLLQDKDGCLVQVWRDSSTAGGVQRKRYFVQKQLAHYTCKDGIVPFMRHVLWPVPEEAQLLTGLPLEQKKDSVLSAMQDAVESSKSSAGDPSSPPGSDESRPIVVQGLDVPDLEGATVSL